MRDEYDFSKGFRGRLTPPAPGKTRITTRIDNEVLDWFGQRADEAGGGSYQTMINQSLWDYLRGVETEQIVRFVLRQELVARQGPDLARSSLPDRLGAPGDVEQERPPEVDLMTDEAGHSPHEVDASIIPPSPPKTKTTIRIDDAVLDWFRNEADRAGGGSYQTIMNLALWECIRGIDSVRIVRTVVREELARHDAQEQDRSSG